MNTRIALIALCMVVLAAGNARAQVVVTTSEAGVQLHWSLDSSARRTFLVYRRLASDAGFPRQPLARVNTATCADIATALQADTLLASLIRPVVTTPGVVTTPQSTHQLLCTVLQGNVNAQAYQLLIRIARVHYRLATLMGSYYNDRAAVVGTNYVYDVRYLDNSGNEVSIGSTSTMAVKAGAAQQLAAPAGVTAYPSDAEIQIVWTPPTYAAPLLVEVSRSTDGTDWSNAVTIETIGTPIDTAINGSILPSTVLSYVDFGGSTGLDNNTQYTYRLRYHAAGGRMSAYSPAITAQPRDTTAPSTPQQLSAEELPTTRSVSIRWNRSFYDAAGRRETMGEYHVYRMLPTTQSVNIADRVGIVRHTDVDTAQNMMVFVDRSAPYDSCRDVTVIYRIVAIDAVGNASSPSAPYTIVLRDRVPPQKVKGVTSQSTHRDINITWSANTDCAVMRYNVYRAYCDYGRWVPCPDERHEQDITTYIDVLGKQRGRERRERRNADIDSATCGGPFALIGSVEHRDGVSSFTFVDNTVPQQSPICYAYVVSAVDSAGNQSVRLPIPDPVRDIVLCANLIDVIPPHPAAINDLQLGDHRITVVASTPSQQDLIGFYVYRTTDTTLPYQFVKAMYYDPSTATFVPSGEKLVRQDDPISCDVIPLGATGPYMQSAFVDDSVLDRVVYYYKVSTVDRNGNESPISLADEIATFTYGRRLQSLLRISDVRPSASGGSLEIGVDVQNARKPIIGYALYRAATQDGAYMQIGQTATALPLSDPSARRGRQYWYRVMLIYADNTYSDLTTPVQGILP